MVIFKQNSDTPPVQQRAEKTHSCNEVHSSPSVQQKRGHVDVAIVSGDVERSETTLGRRKAQNTHITLQT